jgi:WD40 repeat protein
MTPNIRRLLSWLALTAAVAGAGTLARADGSVARVDSYGDPLPPGAVARLGTLRLWHGATVVRVALSPDGKILATGGAHERSPFDSSLEEPADGRVRLWDTASGKPLCTLQGAPKRVVGAMTFSADGKLLAGVYRSEIYLWQSASGKLLHRLATGRDASVSFSSDGRKLYSLSFTNLFVVARDDTEVCSWDVQTGKKLRTWRAARTQEPDPPKDRDVKNGLYSVTLGPDATAMVKEFWNLRSPTHPGIPLVPGFVEKKVLRTIELPSGKLLSEIELSSGVHLRCARVVVSPDCKRFATWEPYTLLVGDVATGKKLWRKQDLRLENEIAAAIFSPDGSLLAVRDSFGTVNVWDARSGKQVSEFTNAANWRFPGYAALAFSADDRLLVCTNGEFVRMWDLPTGKEIPALAGHRDPVSFLQFSADGHSLASSCDRLLCRWDPSKRRQIGRLAMEYPTDGSGHPVLSPDGSVFVAQAPDSSVLLRSAMSGRVVRRLPRAEKMLTAGFARDGRTVFVITSGKEKVTAHIFDVRQGNEVGRIEQPAKDFEWKLMARDVFVAAGAPDGKSLAWLGTQNRLWILQLPSGKVIQRLHAGDGQGASRAPYGLQFAPNGRQLALVVATGVTENYAAERAISLWDVLSGRLLRQIHVRDKGRRSLSPLCLAYSPDGRTLAVSAYGDDRIRLFEVASGRERGALIAHARPTRALAFSPDSKLLASGSDDGTILLWDLRDPRAYLPPDAAVPGPRPKSP